MASVTELVPVVGVAAGCEAVGVARATFYRHTPRHVRPLADRPAPSPRHEGAAGERSEQILPGPSMEVAEGEPPPPPSSPGTGLARVHPRALSAAEQAAVLDVLHSDRFQDAAPATVYATLLDEQVYLASERTMYRLLAAEGETRPRRDQLVHPTYAKPELLATAPNQVWSWDITKLLGPAKWTYFYLYVILDVYSRYVVGWMVAHREHADLAERLIAETIAKQDVPAGQLTLHADRGSSMTSKPVAFLLADLGVTKSHSRPHVSNDNPYSEAQFKTLKYRPGLPSARTSSAGTTPSTVTRASASCHQRSSTPARPRTPTTPARGCSPPPTPLIPSASSVRRRVRPSFRPLPGSIRRRRPATFRRPRQRRCVSNSPRPVSQTY